jgi:hypothetical protein
VPVQTNEHQRRALTEDVEAAATAGTDGDRDVQDPRFGEPGATGMRLPLQKCQNS